MALQLVYQPNITSVAMYRLHRIRQRLGYSGQIEASNS